LVWVDRQGHEEPIPAPPRFYQTARLSPDGTRIAAAIRGQGEDVWLWDFARQTLGRLTVDSAVEANPLWFPDGRRIAYTSSGNLFWRFADGTTSAEAVSDPPGQHVPMSFSPDGSQLVVSNFNPKTLGDLMLVKPETKGEAAPPCARHPRNVWPRSPDGRWIAYQSDESGQHQVMSDRFQHER
jgi:Tol biopolymer transport system component